MTQDQTVFLNVYLQARCGVRRPPNRTVHIRHQCRKPTVLSCHIYLIKTGVKNEQHFNMDYNFDHQMSPSKSKCWYSNNCLQFLKRAVPLKRLIGLQLLGNHKYCTLVWVCDIDKHSSPVPNRMNYGRQRFMVQAPDPNQITLGQCYENTTVNYWSTYFF